MNALKLAVVVAIGFGAASLAHAGPPSCGACSSKDKKTVKISTPKGTLTAASLRITVSACDGGKCPTADCPETCTGPGSVCCDEMGCCEKTACDSKCQEADYDKLTQKFNGLLDEQDFEAALKVAKDARKAYPSKPHFELMVWKAMFARREASQTADAPVPAACSLATCGDAVPATAVVVCSATSDAIPPAPKRLTACNGDACPITVCGSANGSVTLCSALNVCESTDDACPPAPSSATCPLAACGSPCGAAGPIDASPFGEIDTLNPLAAAAKELTYCAAECALACGSACRGAVCDGGPCPNGVCEGSVCETSPCKANCESGVCETAPAAWTAAPALAAPTHAVPYPIAYEPAGLYGVQRTAAVEVASSVSQVVYSTPVESNPGLPVGRWTRTLNDQSVSIAMNADGSFNARSTVPNAGCSLEITGDCRATADGLLFGVVTSAKVCPSDSADAGSVDPVSCVEVEGFCRALIDQPFSARCRTSGSSMTVSHALFGGIGFVGTPGPGEPAHLALTMFSGAYEAE